jgi:hypothetical protein
VFDSDAASAQMQSLLEAIEQQRRVRLHGARGATPTSSVPRSLSE